MVAFCRAFAHGCLNVKANNPCQVDVGKLQKDRVLKEMMEKGYEWRVLCWEAEEAVPTLPDFLQRALNVTNSVAADCTELEVMTFIAEFGSTMKKLDWRKAIEATTAANPPCAAYADTLARFVQLYGGGPKAPIVKHLDYVAKQHSQNWALGVRRKMGPRLPPECGHKKVVQMLTNA